MLNANSGNPIGSRSFGLLTNTQTTKILTSISANPLARTADSTSSRASTSSLQSTDSRGDGLQAQYYQGTNFNELKLSRVDPTIDFNWASGSPDASLSANNYSARWTGKVQPTVSGPYTFYTNSDDGVRLWVNGQLLIDHWSDHPATEDAGSIALTANEKYDIKLEYYEHKGKAIAQVLWSSPSQSKEVIPQSQLYATADSTLPPSDPSLPPPDPNSMPGLPAGNSTPPITATVDWNTVEGKTDSSFGLNAFQGFRSESANDATYQSNMGFMNPGFIRFHNSSAMQDASVPDGLLDTAHQTWDVNKIRSGLTASVSSFGANQPQRMLNIPTWPAWMDANNDGFLDRDQFNNFAQLCADLVKIVNTDLHLNVKYWEVTNEKDDQYFTQFHENGGWGGLKDPSQPDRLNELVDIYNTAATAMKRADPMIEVGGPGIARPDLQPFYVPFIKGTADHLDFFTYHFYATGSADTPDADIYKSTQSIGDYTGTIVQALKTASPDRPIPAMLDEYNISWTWETRDPRMTNNKGVVFDALSTVRALKNGAAATFSWNEKDGIYGKTDDQNQMRPGGTFLHLLNTFMRGDRVSSITSDDSTVTTLAVNNNSLQQKSYLIINHSGDPQTVQTTFTGWRPTQQQPLEEYELSSSGYTERSINWNDMSQGIRIPADSVTLVTASP
jgi:xylan 1,4-beta-xylosidase